MKYLMLLLAVAGVSAKPRSFIQCGCLDLNLTSIVRTASIQLEKNQDWETCGALCLTKGSSHFTVRSGNHECLCLEGGNHPFPCEEVEVIEEPIHRIFCTRLSFHEDDLKPTHSVRQSVLDFLRDSGVKEFDNEIQRFGRHVEEQRDVIPHLLEGLPGIEETGYHRPRYAVLAVMLIVLSVLVMLAMGLRVLCHNKRKARREKKMNDLKEMLSKGSDSVVTLGITQRSDDSGSTLPSKAGTDHLY